MFVLLVDSLARLRLCTSRRRSSRKVRAKGPIRDYRRPFPGPCSTKPYPMLDATRRAPSASCGTRSDRTRPGNNTRSDLNTREQERIQDQQEKYVLKNGHLLMEFAYRRHRRHLNAKNLGLFVVQNPAYTYQSPSRRSKHHSKFMR